MAAGFLGAVAVDTSPPNTAITHASGARTQLANILAVLVVVVVLVAFTAGWRMCRRPCSASP